MSKASRTIGWATAATDLCLLFAAYFSAYEVRYYLGWFPGVYDWDRYLVLLLTAGPVWLVSGGLLGLYRGRRRSLRREISSIAATAAITCLVLAALAFLLKQQHQSRPLVVLFTAIAFLDAALLRVLARWLGIGRSSERSRVIVVGSGEQAEDICASLLRRRDARVELLGVITEEPNAPAPAGARWLGSLEQSEQIFRGEVVDEVVFAVPRTKLDEVEHAFEVAEDLGLDAKLCLTFLPHRRARIDFDEVDGTPVLAFSSTPWHPVQLAAKRTFDLVVSVTALVLCAPLFAVLAALIKLDGGPVFFGQKRSGRNGRDFTLWKFRSMVVDAEAKQAALAAQNEMSGPVFKMAEDPRVTSFGRFLRRTSIDELPQFWNVLVGEMSVVGPRPPLPTEVVRYERWQRRRLSVKPGITCLWQISGRNEVDFDTWMKLDLAYIDGWSLWLDTKIFFKTIPAVLLGRGAR